MTIAIMILVLVNTAAVAYLAMTIFDMHDHVSKGFNSQLEIMKLQNELLRNDLDALNRWADTTTDLIAHVERIEDLEGDIKDIFEWIHSVDNNVADMRRDIQDTETKLGDLMAVYDKNVSTFSDALLSLQKDIRKIKEKPGPERYNWNDWTHIAVDNSDYGDTDGDIPTNIISGCGNYRQFLSSNDKDVDALYEEIADRSMKKYETILKGEDKGGQNGNSNNT